MDTVTKAGAQSAESPWTFVMSSESVDRTGDIIRVKGWELSDFKSSPVAMYGHDHTIPPVGLWKNVRVVGKQLLGDLQLAKEGTSDLIDTIRKLVEQRILNAVSVGFMPVEANPRKGGGYEFTKSILTECSLVNVGCNPDALAIIKAINPQVADQLFVQLDAGVSTVDGQSTHETITPNLEAARTRLKAMGIDY